MSDLGLHLSEAWTGDQVAVVRQLIDRACDRVAQHQQFTASEAGAWRVLQGRGIDLRGAAQFPSGPVVELGRAIGVMLGGELPAAPEGTWWLLGPRVVVARSPRGNSTRFPNMRCRLTWTIIPWVPENAVNDTDKYILDAIKTRVWSGFYGAAEVDEMIDDILEDGADEQMLRAAVHIEFEKKRASEPSWPAVTDCDRLDKAFHRLNTAGVIALQNAGYTMSDGHDDVAEVLEIRGRKGVTGYCFYHGQDLERAVAGMGLWLAFGDLQADSAQAVVVGHKVCVAIRKSGLEVEWNGDPKVRIVVPSLDWKRRGASATRTRPWWRFW